MGANVTCEPLATTLAKVLWLGLAGGSIREEWVEAKVSLSSSTDLATVLVVSVSEAIVLFHSDVCKGIREVE